MMGGRYYNRYGPNCLTKQNVPAIVLLYFNFCRISNAPHLSNSVGDIIDHYKKEQIVEGYNLKEPVSVQVSATHPARCDVLNTTGQQSTCFWFFFTGCSTRSRFLLTQWMAEKFITLSGGKQKTLFTKTLWRKATSCSTKVWKLPAIIAHAVSALWAYAWPFPLALRQRQAMEESLLHPGGERRPAHLLWEWKESNQTQRADRSERVFCLWCSRQPVRQVRYDISCSPSHTHTRAKI